MSKAKHAGFCITNLTEDKDKIANGVLFPFMQGASFLIKRYGSVEFNKTLAASFKENEAAIASGSDEGNKLAESNFLAAYAEHILVGWEGVLDEKGNPVKFSTKKAIQYLEIAEVFDFVEGKAKGREHWRIKAVDTLSEDLKN